MNGIFHEHRHIRENGVTNSVCDAGVFVINIIESDSISVVINADIQNATVGVRKRNDLFIYFFGESGFEFDIFSFVIHIGLPPNK